MALDVPTTGPLAELRQAIWRHIVAELPTVSVPRRESSFDDLVTIYAGWRMRLPAAVPRSVHLSGPLLANPLLSSYAAEIMILREEIEKGRSLLPRVHKDIEHADGPAGPYILRRKRRERHLDRLLSDWEMHHLHLSSKRGRAPFNKRTRHVLVVAFDGPRALCIDLIDHESNGANWSTLHLLEVLVRTWPDQRLVHGMEGVRIDGGNVSDEDRRHLRNGNVNTGAEIDGVAYFGSGITGAGTSMRAGQHSMGISWWLAGWDYARNELDPDRMAANILTTLDEAAEEHGVEGWSATVHQEWAGFCAEHVFVPCLSLVPDR